MLNQIEAHSGEFHPGMKLIDLHTHSNNTDGWLDVERTIKQGLRRGVSGLAGTDHDSIRFGYDLREEVAKHPDLPFEEVVVGSEVTAKRKDRSDVHVIGLFLENDLKRFQSIGDTVESILKDGGEVVFPHPGHIDPRVSALTYEEITEVALRGIPVILETYNASIEDLRPIFWLLGHENTNKKAKKFYEDNPELIVGQVGGTDSHFRTFSRGLTAYEGDLREAITSRKTVVVYRTGMISKREKEVLMPWDVFNHKTQLKRRNRERVEYEAQNGIIYHAEAG